MTEREALKLALEALENVYGKGKRCEAAIAAIKQVLAQPGREWQGLTDEEREIASWTDGSFGAGARWAEATLKEKNT